MTPHYLVDNSAWARLDSALLPAERREEIARAAAEARLWASGVLRLEAGYSARHASAHAALMSRLGRFAYSHLDEAVVERAAQLQSQLAQVGHHRVAPPDLLVAAMAERDGLTVLHYDKDYDVICEKSDCVAATEWLAPRGSL